ncbi:GNAT family N-acetyltransferase [Timonella senegalensis]|uniref:GNAT family N-acetyltransferase n=1 Tax=Timonella senegalensis TaxID=1465825 RepID=UPI0006883836|nr:GNAT family N-acetyltransferase [Timonella senegalensis]
MTELLSEPKMTGSAPNLRLTQWMAPAAFELRHASANELCKRYNTDSIGSDPDGDKAVAMIVLSVLIHGHREDIGCAALMDMTGVYDEFDTPVVEVKRVYIRPEFRGNGYSWILMKEVEDHARRYSQRPDRLGLRVLLETGTEQPEAIGLYEKMGFQRIDTYGPWKNDPTSMCYELILD